MKKILIFAFSISLFVSSFNSSFADEKPGLIIYFNNNLKNSAADSLLFCTINNKLINRIKSSSVFNDYTLIQDTSDSIKSALSPEDFKSLIPGSRNKRCYLILGSINSFNQLIYVKADVYFIYQGKPLKYLTLFGLKTKYYHPAYPPQIELQDRILPEILLQLKTGFDNKINVVFKSVISDSAPEQFNFLKNAVPEYLKSRLVISPKIKVHRDTIITKVEGVTQMPQYIVDAFIFYDRNQIHIIANCIDYNEDQIIISKQISFNADDPGNLETEFYLIGDDFRNAILNLYNSRIQKRKISLAVIAKPPFFPNPENVDEYGMQLISRKIISSFISSFRSDSDMRNHFEFVRNSDYFEKINEYLNHETELSIIANELNAEVLIVLQTTGLPKDFDMSIEEYHPRAVNEVKQVGYIQNIDLNNVESTIDQAYCKIRNNLLAGSKPGNTIICSADSLNENNIKSPSEFYESIPGKLGLRISGMHSFINTQESSHLFLGNYLRPAVEFAGYYALSSSTFKFPVTFEISFMYDFGKYRDYAPYGQDAQGEVYARNLNFILKFHYPFFGRVKNMWRPYLAGGLTLIDIHRSSTSQIGGSFEPGFILEAGVEYSLSYSLFMDFNFRYLCSDHNFTTLSEYSDSSIDGGAYKVFYIGGGFGYEF